MSPIFWHEAALADQLLYVFFRKNIGFLFIVAMQANQKVNRKCNRYNLSCDRKLTLSCCPGNTCYKQTISGNLPQTQRVLVIPLAKCFF